MKHHANAKNETLDSNSIKVKKSDFVFVKHNKALSKPWQREENKRMLLDFFASLECNVKGMKGSIIMENLKDQQEMFILTFWETK